MSTVQMLTVVPSKLAKELESKKKISDYNTLPQLNDFTMSAIRDFMVENVGYPNLPMACLSNVKAKSVDTDDILSIIPANRKDNVLFQLVMPEDMIVSIRFSELLDIANEAKQLASHDSLEAEILKDRLTDALSVGCEDTDEDIISFIPFLAYDKCKFYAPLDSEIGMSEFRLNGIPENTVKQLTSFFNV